MAVAGDDNPICINWEPLTGGKKGSLKVKAISQTAAEVSILDITKQGEGRFFLQLISLTFSVLA